MMCVGWFELMSVDGRTAPVMGSVRQLVEVFPARCLVRKTINVMTTDDVCHGIGSRSRRVGRGELLTLVNVIGQRLLQCRDEKGCDVYMPLNQRGLFSAINGQTTANVYSLRSLLTEFRLPISVRVASGSLPIRDATAADLRLVGIQTDRMTFVLPLSHAWTSKTVDRRALVAVPSRHASRLTVAAAVRDFYYRWVMSDDGLELKRRCNEIVESWKVSVHVVSGSISAAAAAAAAATSRSYDGDDATWSRGPLLNSSDSGLASSASLPSFRCTSDDIYNDHDDYIHLEQEIDDIYAMIRYGSEGRLRSLDGKLSRQSLDRLSGGDVYSHRPMLGGYRARRSSVEMLHSPRGPPAIVVCSVQRRGSRVSSSGVGTRPSSLRHSVNDVKPATISFQPEDDTDNVQNGAFNPDYGEEISNSSGRELQEAHAVVGGYQRHSCPTDEVCNCDERDSTTSSTADPRRSRSKSLPEVTAPTPDRSNGKSHKSVIGTLTRSIANVFRRMRPHRVSHTFVIDTGVNTVVNERYSRRTPDHSDFTWN